MSESVNDESIINSFTQEITQLKRDGDEKDELIQKIRKQRDSWRASDNAQIENLSQKLANADAEKAKAINVAIR
ncbi:MAG: hypothetical protein HOM11_06825, partial [Methylococcales bacterium]|nr:hypothetical protein [Methylococcales bacterium]